jgi:hypothetical protein
VFILALVQNKEEVLSVSEQYRVMVKLHGLVGLLADMYSTPLATHGKTASSIIQAISGNEGEEVLKSLGYLHR